jgi:two-component system, chemotaxis family, chemotaxis protein CheY
MDTEHDVLLVDNYPAMTRMLCSILRELGFKNIDQASNGLAALSMIRSNAYRLVFSDLNMEPMSGMQLLQEVRADPKLKSTRFIMISGSGTPEQVLGAKDRGATDYIVKPFTIETVRKKLAGLGMAMTGRQF